jgi:hypothetical protein
MDFKFNRKNNVGILSSIVLIILLSHSTFFNLLTETILGKILMITFIIFIFYTNRGLGLLTALIVLWVFNHNANYYNGIEGLSNMPIMGSVSGWNAVSAMSSNPTADKAAADKAAADKAVADKAAADAAAALAAAQAVADKAVADKAAAQAVADKAAAQAVADKAAADKASNAAAAEADTNKAAAHAAYKKERAKIWVLTNFKDFNPRRFDEFYDIYRDFNPRNFMEEHPFFGKSLEINPSVNKWSKNYKPSSQIESFKGLDWMKNLF